MTSKRLTSKRRRQTRRLRLDGSHDPQFDNMVRRAWRGRRREWPLIRVVR